MLKKIIELFEFIILGIEFYVLLFIIFYLVLKDYMKYKISLHIKGLQDE